MYSPTTFHLLAEDFHRDRLASRRAFGSRPSPLAAMLERRAVRRAERALHAAQAPARPIWPLSARD